MGMKKERKLLWISVCLLSPSDAAGKEVPNGEQLNAKCSFSRRLFCKRSLPPNPSRRDQQKPASDQKVTYQKLCHKKKAVMVAKDVAAVLVFHWALSMAPLSAGVVWYQRETHSQACRGEAGFDLDGFVTVWDEG